MHTLLLSLSDADTLPATPDNVSWARGTLGEIGIVLAHIFGSHNNFKISKYFWRMFNVIMY